MLFDSLYDEKSDFAPAKRREVFSLERSSEGPCSKFSDNRHGCGCHLEMSCEVGNGKEMKVYLLESEAPAPLLLTFIYSPSSDSDSRGHTSPRV